MDVANVLFYSFVLQEAPVQQLFTKGESYHLHLLYLITPLL